jgi:hypothetical protein
MSELRRGSCGSSNLELGRVKVATQIMRSACPPLISTDRSAAPSLGRSSSQKGRLRWPLELRIRMSLGAPDAGRGRSGAAPPGLLAPIRARFSQGYRSCDFISAAKLLIELRRGPAHQ